MADRVVVTIAARYGMDLAGIADDLPPGLTVQVRESERPAVKAATPDQWNAWVQLLFDAGDLAKDVAVGLLSAWLYDRLRGRGPTQPTYIDQSQHIDLRLIVGVQEKTEADPAEIARAILDAIAAEAEPTGPPQLDDPQPDRPSDADAGGWEDAWVEAQLASARRYHEDMKRRGLLPDEADD